MWMYFLFCLFAKVLLAASLNTTTIQSWTLVESNNASSPKSAPQATSSPLPARWGHQRDVLVVLPVMQGDSDLTHSNLQMLYTKTPVTAIINDQPVVRSTAAEGRRSTPLTGASSSTTLTPPTTTVTTTAAYSPPRVITDAPTIRTTISATSLIKRDDSRHPYTDFLFTKSAPKTHKSPLDYGYPETFKFVQELNELPKNHKPEWAQSELAEAEAKKPTTTEGSTKGDPFQMFESVKPLEINKLFSLKSVAVPVTDSVFEETAVKKQEGTEAPHRATKRPFQKRPPKKPQKVKLSPQKLSDAELAPFIPFMMASTDKPTAAISSQSTTQEPQSSTTASSPATSTSTQTPASPSTAKSEVELYDAARYSTLFAESTKVFLPTPYQSTSDRAVIHTVHSPSTTPEPSSESWSPMTSPLTTPTTTTAASITTSTTAAPTKTTTSSSTTSSTTASTPFALNFNWADAITSATPAAESSTPAKVVAPVKSSDLISLTKILDEHFHKKHAAAGWPTTTAKPHFPADMLTGDMKNMLIALGLLKAEDDSSSPLLLVTSTVAPSSTEPHPTFNSLFARREPVTPSIDPNSYLSFKKLPLDPERPQVSNDMRDLLSSFGLLPSAKSPHLGTNSILTRISRQQKAQSEDTSMDMLDDKMRQTLENLGLVKPMVQQANRKGHVFQPSVHLEKLASPQQVDKINSALETIRMLSKSKDLQTLPIEQLEQKLRNATALLREENLLDGNATDTPELTTELLSTMRNFIFYSSSTTATAAKSINTTRSATPTAKSAPTTTPAAESTNTTKSATPTTSESTPTTSSPSDTTASSTTIFGRRTNSSLSTTSSYSSRRRGTSRMTSTVASTSVSTTTTTSTTTSSTPPTTISTTLSAKPSATPSTTASLKAESPSPSTSSEPTTPSAKIELGLENSISSSSSTFSIVTPATVNLFPEEHNEVNYTPDASSVSLVKLSHNKNNTVMSPPPNPLSIEELQNLLESNRNDVKRQQPKEDSSTTTSTSTIDTAATESNTSISSVDDTSSISNNSKTSITESINDSFSDENSSPSSSTDSSTTEESSIKDDNNAPLEALADSFGGENEEQVDSWQANAKPNGLYFLLDWNTFLSVGEEDKRPVRIRFTPRAGNPRNFMPIKVP